MGSKSVNKSENRRSSSARNSVNGSQKGAAPKFIRPAKPNTPAAAKPSLHPLLTPISRLKRFQKLRDRNLVRQGNRVSLGRRASAMEVAAELAAPLAPMVKEKGEPEGEQITTEEAVTNGHSSETQQTNGLDKHETETRKSPRKEKQEVRVNGDTTPKKKEEEDDEDEEVEVVAVSDKEEELIDEQPVKILRRSLRHSPKRSDSPRVSPMSRESDVSEYLTSHPEIMSQEFRISGRRGIRPSPLGKRKSDMEEPPAKRNVFDTPSVASPGWKFFSSPFNRLWPSTPGRPNRPEDDSLFVNVSTDSESSLSGPSEAETNQNADSPEPPPSKSWLCSVM